MTLDVIVKEDGTLIAQAPKLLRGNELKLSCARFRRQYAAKKRSQWDDISAYATMRKIRYGIRKLFYIFAP